MRWFAACTAVLVIGCSAQRPPQAPAHAVQPSACPAHGSGLTVSVHDSTDGSVVVYEHAQPGSIDVIRAQLLQNAAASSARASGGAPLRDATPMPPVTVGIDRSAGALTVRYHAIEPADVPRVRSLVRWDASQQEKGACPSLRVAADAEPDPLVDVAMPEVEPRFWTPAVTGVRIDAALLRRCRQTSLGAFVAVDLMDPRPHLYPLIERVVQCLTSGPLAASRVVIVGLDDPVQDEFLAAGGRSRSEVLAELLVARGIERARLTTRRVDRGPAGTDRRGWAWYRRVDLELGP